MILRAFLFVLALANAAGRRLFRLGLPRVPSQPGWKQRLALATVVAMTTLLASCGKKPQRGIYPTCYAPRPPAIQPTNSTLRFSDSIRTIWTSLDTKQTAAFTRALNGMVKDGKLTANATSQLGELYQQIASHRERQTAGMDCYKMSVLGMAKANSCNAVSQQINCLRQARENKTLDEATITKITTTLARSIEAMKKVKTLAEDDRQAWDALEKSLKDDTLVPSAEATATANLILELEAITPPVPKPPTPATHPEPGKQEAL